jgi:ADP-ribose pyrophosphatase
MIEPWPTVESKDLGDYRVFRLGTRRRRSPRTGREHDFLVLDCRNWVNVVALTPENELILVEQFRHGTETIELEIPGGVIDTAEEPPLEAGLRELREETGYVGEGGRIIGEVYSNPAIMNNRTYTVLVENCRQTHDTEFDHGEDIITRLVPVDEALDMAAAGKIRHSLVVAALFHFERARRREA